MQRDLGRGLAVRSGSSTSEPGSDAVATALEIVLLMYIGRQDMPKANAGASMSTASDSARSLRPHLPGRDLLLIELCLL